MPDLQSLPPLTDTSPAGLRSFGRAVDERLRRLALDLGRLQGRDTATPSFANHLDIGGNRVTHVGDPRADDDVVTLGYLRQFGIVADPGEPLVAQSTLVAAGGIRTGTPATAPLDLVPFSQLQEYVSAVTAPLAPSYITVTNEAGLPNERALAVGSGLSLTDGGAGASITVALDVDLQEIAALANVRGDLLVTNAGPNWTRLPIGAANRVLRSDGADPSWAQVVLTTDVTGILPIANGGTGLSALGTASQLVSVNDAGTALEYVTIQGTASEIDVSVVGSVITIGLVDPLAVTKGGTGLATVAQGDLLYGSALNTLAALTKDANATRYLANTGASNSPAWAQVNLANGVTGQLPLGNGGTGINAASVTDLFNQLDPLTTRGDLLTRDATNSIRLGVGAADTVLLSNATDPAWGKLVRANVTTPTGTTDTFVFATAPTFVTNITTPIVYGGAASTNTLDIHANDETFALANTGRVRFGERITVALSASTSASLQDAFITDTSTITTSHNTLVYSGFKFSPTLNYSTSLNVGFSPAFWANPSFRPTTTVADLAGTVTLAGFHSSPRWEPNTAAISPVTSALVGYLAGPKARLLAGTAGTVPTMTSFASMAYLTYDVLALGENHISANMTVTTLRGFHHADPNSAGTVTTHIGLDIGALAVGTTIIGIRNASTTVNTEVVSTITAVGSTVSHAASTIRLNNTSGGSLTLTSAPTISDGVNNEVVTIYNGSANNVVLQDQPSAGINTNLRLSAATITLAQRDSIVLMYSSTIGDWIQIGQTNVL